MNKVNNGCIPFKCAISRGLFSLYARSLSGLLNGARPSSSVWNVYFVRPFPLFVGACTLTMESCLTFICWRGKVSLCTPQICTYEHKLWHHNLQPVHNLSKCDAETWSFQCTNNENGLVQSSTSLSTSELFDMNKITREMKLMLS